MTIHKTVYSLAKAGSDKPLQLAALTAGNPDGQVVLCLHGWLDNAASFKPLMEELQRSNSPLLNQCYFIAFDWAGHGLSSHRSADAYYYFTDWVDDLYQLIEAQNWHQVVLLGHSMGAMVANLFASAFNERVKSLYLIEGIGLLPLTEHPSTQLRNGILSRQKTRLKSRHQSLETAIAARINVSDLNYQQAKLLTQRSMKHATNGYQWLSDPRVRHTSVIRYSATQIEQIIAHIECPVTVFFGASGFESVQKGIAQWQSVYRQLHSIKLNGGHHVHMEDVQTLAQHLTNCLSN